MDRICYQKYLKLKSFGCAFYPKSQARQADAKGIILPKGRLNLAEASLYRSGRGRLCEQDGISFWGVHMSTRGHTERDR